jgi:predicted permease
MRYLDVLRLRLRSLFRRGATDRELDRELRFHLDQRAAELVEAGMHPAAARRTALREFGSIASISDQCRDTRRVNVAMHLLQDLRYAARTLLAEPMLLAAATVSIALGVGANLAIFGLANALLLSTPHAFRPDRLVHVRTEHGSHAPYRVWEHLSASGVLAGIAGHQIEANVNWRGAESSVPIAPLIVTPNFFDVLGVPLALGRGFSASETARDPRLAVVSHRFWMRRLGGDTSAIGSRLVLNGEPYTIVGIARPGLRSFPGYGIVPDVWLPVSPALMPDLDHPTGGHLQLVGRLHDGQERAEAHAALSTVAARLGGGPGRPEGDRIRSVTPVGGMEQARDFKEVAAFFAVLLVVTLLVLTIACANVAGLLLARGTARRREIALRLALGASRGRIAQQVLVEGLVLSLAGTLAGLALVAAAGQLLARISLPLPLPIEFHLTLDTRVAAFATILVVASGVLCSLAPAWQATRPWLMPGLKQPTVMSTSRRFTLRSLLVTGQVAISVLLLVTTLLFLRNLALAHTLSPEFDADRALVAQITFVEGRQGSRASPSIESIADRVRSLPGIEAAAFSSGIPLTMYTGRIGTELRIEGRDAPVRVDYEENSVGPDYFRALGIAIRRGREFAPSDRVGAPVVVVINQEFARRYCEGLDPIGRHIFLPTEGQPTPAEVVGIAADSKYRTIGEGRVPALYTAYLQRGGQDRFVHLVTRTSAPPASMAAAVRASIQRMDESAAVSVEPMNAALAFAFLPSRIGAAIVGLLGILGATLAMVGLYGVIAFAVTRRTSEIGIRLALGAPLGAVLRLVLSDGGVLVAIGLTAGLGLAWFVTAPLSAFLVAELPSRDPISFTASAGVLIVTSVLASWVPARRATKIPPAIALRAE